MRSSESFDVPYTTFACRLFAFIDLSILVVYLFSNIHVLSVNLIP